MSDDLTIESIRIGFAVSRDNRNMSNYRYDQNAGIAAWDRIRDQAFADFDRWLKAHDDEVRLAVVSQDTSNSDERETLARLIAPDAWAEPRPDYMLEDDEQEPIIRAEAFEAADRILAAQAVQDTSNGEAWDAAIEEARKVVARGRGPYETDIDLLALMNPFKKTAENLNAGVVDSSSVEVRDTSNNTDEARKRIDLFLAIRADTMPGMIHNDAIADIDMGSHGHVRLLESDLRTVLSVRVSSTDTNKEQQ